MKTFLIVLMLLASSLMAVAHASEDALFSDFDGQPQTVESYTGDGKWLVVMIWAHDCGVCNQEAESYAQFHLEHKDTKARMLGISMDGAAKKADAEAFIARHDLPFPNLLGELMPTMAYYATLTESQFRGTPTLLIFGPDGELRAAQAGAVPITSIERFIAEKS